jgi:hypothetical protein
MGRDVRKGKAPAGRKKAKRAQKDQESSRRFPGFPPDSARIRSIILEFLAFDGSRDDY